MIIEAPIIKKIKVIRSANQYGSKYTNLAMASEKAIIQGRTSTRR
jgi:hypothetical protein